MFDKNVDAIVGLYTQCNLPTCKRMHLSDALSCLSSHNKAAGKTIKNLNVSMHAIEELTGFNSISAEKLCQDMANDQDLKLLITSTMASQIH